MFAILSVIFGLEFAFIPIQFTIISAITIGIPSFFLTFESNKEKVSTHFMRDILTNAAIGGGILVVSVLLTNFFITVGQVKFICFLLALINGLCLVAKVSLPFNRYKLVLLIILSLAALVGVLANTFILRGAFVPLETTQVLYVAVLAVVIGSLHYLTRRKVDTQKNQDLILILFIYILDSLDYMIPKKRAAIPTAKRARMIAIGDTFS